MKEYYTLWVTYTLCHVRTRYVKINWGDMKGKVTAYLSGGTGRNYNDSRPTGRDLKPEPRGYAAGESEKAPPSHTSTFSKGIKRPIQLHCMQKLLLIWK